MTIELINLGQYANDGTGDDLRTAFEKVNSNFTTLNLTLGVTNGTNVGSGSQLFKAKVSDTLQFRTLRSPNGSVSVVSTDNTVDLSVTTELSTDLTPVLGGDLNLNGNIIYNGDAQTTVYGYSVPLTSGLLELILAGNTYTIDFGSFLDPTGGGNGGIDLDFGEIGFDSFANGIDFGTISVPSGVSGGGGESEVTYTPPQSLSSIIDNNILTLDCNYAWHIVTLDQDITQVNFANVPAAPGIMEITVEFIQDNTGSWTVTSPTYLTLGGALNLQSTPNSTSLVIFRSRNGASTVFASYVGGGWV
jgi:hypothetical protein